ncbi:MAG: hypothetical protein LBT48_00790 [Prevotellaceae bacterium]|jgi:ABC-type Na+ efflux pump permease subunit|nr:hypothetical protein [Prevotellaceae bacterium]
MSEVINSVEPTTHQTAKERNWAGIIGFGLAVVAIILVGVAFADASSHQATNPYGNRSAQLARAHSEVSNGMAILGSFIAAFLGSLLMSFIGLFFKPRAFAVAGLITALGSVLLILAVMATAS